MMAAYMPPGAFVPGGTGDAMDRAAEDWREGLAQFFERHETPGSPSEEDRYREELMSLMEKTHKPAFLSAGEKWSKGDGQGAADDLRNRRVR